MVITIGCGCKKKRAAAQALQQADTQVTQASAADRASTLYYIIVEPSGSETKFTSLGDARADLVNRPTGSRLVQRREFS